MLRYVLAAVLAIPALPALSQTEKEVSCGYQADVVDAIQQARLDDIKEQDVKDKILSSDPAWPDNYSNAIPVIAPWVYELPIKQVRNNDLGDVWEELCLQQ
jgi:hypothetical protein